jgi:hypothetical protein
VEGGRGHHQVGYGDRHSGLHGSGAGPGREILDHRGRCVWPRSGPVRVAHRPAPSGATVKSRPVRVLLTRHSGLQPQ